MRRPGRPTPDCGVLVVGGGVAGVSLAYALARRGVDTMLIDRSAGTREVAGGAGGGDFHQAASSLPAALLNPHRGRTGRASAADLAGLSAFWKVASRLEAAGLAPGAHRSGVLRVASSSRQRDLWRALSGPLMLAAHDFPAHVSAKYGGLLVPGGGWVEPGPWLRALTTAAQALGAVVDHGVELLSLTHGDVVAAETSTGVIRAGEVVLCLGAYDAQRLRLPELELAPGVAATFELEHDLGRDQPPLAGSIGIVFAGSRAFVSGGGLTGDDADVERLRSSAAWFVPSLAAARVTSVWRGVRARRPSGIPVARRLRSGLTLFGALGGRGFLCSSSVAAGLATHLAGQLAHRSADRRSV